MAKTFHLTVARVGENLFDGEATSATLPGVEGVFTILAGHESLVSPLKEGELTIVDAEGKTHTLTLSVPGVAEVSQNQATILL